MRILALLALVLVACGDGDAPEADAAPADASCITLPSVPESCPDIALTDCGVADNGWNVWCADGKVFVDDLTAYLYCACGSSSTVCSTGGTGDEYEVRSCPSGCVDEDVHYLEVLQEFQDFDPASLCL
jgi:hypothetical protein